MEDFCTERLNNQKKENCAISKCALCSLLFVFIKTVNGWHCLPSNRLFVVSIRANVFINSLLTPAQHTIEITEPTPNQSDQGTDRTSKICSLRAEQLLQTCWSWTCRIVVKLTLLLGNFLLQRVVLRYMLHVRTDIIYIA